MEPILCIGCATVNHPVFLSSLRVSHLIFQLSLQVNQSIEYNTNT